MDKSPPVSQSVGEALANLGNESPRYAIVRLRPKDDVFNLFRILIQHGYPEVSFVNGLKDTIIPWALASALSFEQQQPNSDDNSVNSPKNESTDTGSDHSDSGNTSAPARSDSLPLNKFKSEENDSKQSVGEQPLMYSFPQMGNPAPISSLVPTLPLGHSLSSQLTNSLSNSLSSFQAGASGLLGARETATPPYSMGNTNSSLMMGHSANSLLGKMPALQPSQLQLSGGSLTSGLAFGPSIPKITQASTLPMSSMNVSLNSIANPATAQLRQRGSRAQCDDPSVYVACRLCQNKIMASRLSNLTNHVRRHSALKQFQCCYCDYTHNEMAKVRLHMLHNHKDKDSQPIDNLSPEMQASWDVLMQQCFPDHYQGSGNQQAQGPKTSQPQQSPVQQAQVQATSGYPVSNAPRFSPQAPPLEPERPIMAPRNVDTRQLLTCFECGEMIDSNERLDHISRHHMECHPFVCSLCGYDHPEQGKILLHITLKHGNNTSAQVYTRDINIVAEALIPKYFPNTTSEMSPVSADGGEYSPGSTDNSERKDSTDSSGRSLDQHQQSPKVQPQNMLPSDFGSGSPLGGSFHLPSGFDGSDDDQAMAANLRCQLCKKILEGVRPLSSLLNHAKRHYHLKQFQCTECPYSSSEAAHVRSHMKLKHHITTKPPLDKRCPSMQVAWMQTLVRCFPTMARRLKKFRFKTFRNKPSGRPRASRSGSSESNESEDEPDDGLLVVDESQEATPTDVNSPSANQSPQEAEPMDDSIADDQSAPGSDDGDAGTGDDGGDEGEEEGEKKTCQICSAVVPVERLSDHVLSHVPIKPYGCSVCQYRSADYQQLRAHMWKHKLIGGDRVKASISENDARSVQALKEEYMRTCFGLGETGET